jgi:hypothetical protein
MMCCSPGLATSQRHGTSTCETQHLYISRSLPALMAVLEVLMHMWDSTTYDQGWFPPHIPPSTNLYAQHSSCLELSASTSFLQHSRKQKVNFAG